MPGYGVLPAGDGSGLLPWHEVEPRLAGSHDYWLATAWPDGRPHVMPVWGVWDGSCFWCSSAVRSRKIVNLRRDPRCVVAADDALDPVILDGLAELVTDGDAIGTFLGRMNAKYDTDYGRDFLDPAVNATVRVRPHAAFALLQSDFAGSPTRGSTSDGR